MTDDDTQTPLADVPTSGVRDGLGAVQDVDEKKREVLVDIPWETLDSFRSDFSRECFDAFLGERLPVMCWQHNKAEPIGRAQTWSKGQRANQFVARFSDFDAVPRARQAFAQIRDADITDFSFYYDQAVAVAHPNTRGAIRFTKARMPEISPVTVGSIPGAMATGVRQAADANGIAELVRSKVITEEEGRAMLGLAEGAPSVGERQEPAQRDRVVIASGLRGVVVTVDDDGQVSVQGGTDAGPAVVVDPSGRVTEPADDETDASPASIAQQLDDYCDAADTALASVDTTSLPNEVQEALHLYGAASVAADELLEALGLPDDDTGDQGEGDEGEGDDGTREAAPVDAPADGERVDYADPGYQDDKQKRYPIDTAEHVRAALSYIGQTDNAAKYSDENLAKVKDRIAAAAKKFGIKVSDEGSGKRQADDVDVETQAALARLALNRH